jgi:hypothetical protein
VTEDAHDDAPSHANTHAGSDEHAASGHDDHAASGHDDHGEPRLGPIDWQAWLYAVGGFAAGLLVVGVFWLKT